MLVKIGEGSRTNKWDNLFFLNSMGCFLNSMGCFIVVSLAFHWRPMAVNSWSTWPFPGCQGIRPPKINNERNKRHKHNDPILHDIFTKLTIGIVSLIIFHQPGIDFGPKSPQTSDILGQKSPVFCWVTTGEGISLLLPFWGKYFTILHILWALGWNFQRRYTRRKVTSAGPSQASYCNSLDLF